jgi:hypothetical protein
VHFSTVTISQLQIDLQTATQGTSSDGTEKSAKPTEAATVQRNEDVLQHAAVAVRAALEQPQQHQQQQGVLKRPHNDSSDGNVDDRGTSHDDVASHVAVPARFTAQLLTDAMKRVRLSAQQQQQQQQRAVAVQYTEHITNAAVDNSTVALHSDEELLLLLEASQQHNARGAQSQDDQLQ